MFLSTLPKITCSNGKDCIFCPMFAVCPTYSQCHRFLDVARDKHWKCKLFVLPVPGIQCLLVNYCGAILYSKLTKRQSFESDFKRMREDLRDK